MRITKLFLLFFFPLTFFNFNTSLARNFENKNKMPTYLRSSSVKKASRSLTKFEKEVAEVDPFLKDNLPMNTDRKSDEFPDNFDEYQKMSDKDMEDIFSSANEGSTTENQEFDQARPSLIDRISSQEDEIEFNNKDFDKSQRTEVVKNRQKKQREKALINEVFGPEFPEEENETTQELVNNKNEQLAFEEEKNPTPAAAMRQPEEEYQRQPASYEAKKTSGHFKSGMYIFYKNCVLYSEPEETAEPWGFVKSGKELWVDKFTDQWHKAYTKEGPVFLKASCLN